MPPLSPGARCALTAPFHPCRPFGEAVCFLWHFPAARADWPLTSTLPYGARTFLPPPRPAVTGVHPDCSSGRRSTTRQMAVHVTRHRWSPQARASTRRRRGQPLPWPPALGQVEPWTARAANQRQKHDVSCSACSECSLRACRVCLAHRTGRVCPSLRAPPWRCGAPSRRRHGRSQRALLPVCTHHSRQAGCRVGGEPHHPWWAGRTRSATPGAALAAGRSHRASASSAAPSGSPPR